MKNTNLFRQRKTSESQPIESGWYDTDKGILWWFNNERIWSCRSEYCSDEYPSVWYEETQPTENDKDIVCPFCNEDGFDKKGLKHHLLNYCKEYSETDLLES